MENVTTCENFKLISHRNDDQKNLTCGQLLI